MKRDRDIPKPKIAPCDVDYHEVWRKAYEKKNKSVSDDIQDYLLQLIAECSATTKTKQGE